MFFMSAALMWLWSIFMVVGLPRLSSQRFMKPISSVCETEIFSPKDFRTGLLPRVRRSATMSTA